MPFSVGVADLVRVLYCVFFLVLTLISIGYTFQGFGEFGLVQ
jgi:hypothetical protein